MALIGIFLGVMRYQAAGRLFHVRFGSGQVVDAGHPFCLIHRTPDGDSYEEDTSDRQNIAEVLFATDHATIPGIPAGEVYPFGAAPTLAEKTLWIAEGTAIANGAHPGQLRPVLAPGLVPPHAAFVTVEAMLRRAQTIEFGWGERIREKEAKLAGNYRLSLAEWTVCSGVSRAASNLMVCPALLDDVRVEVDKDAKLQKALRLAREEREASDKKNKREK